MKQIVPAFLSFLILLSPAYADSIRGSVTSILAPGSGNSDTRFSAGDLVVIQPESLNPMSGALEIELKIPDAVRNYRGSYAVYLYKRVTPSPSTGIKNYRAEAIDFYLLPPSSRFSLYVPLTDDYTVQESFDVSLAGSQLREDDFPLVLTVLPVMKGIPSTIAASVFEVSVSFAASTSGTLRVELAFPDTGDLPYSLAIDGVTVEGPGTDYVLEQGLHTLDFTSQSYLDETVTFSVEAGAYTDLRLEVERRSSRFIAEVPEGTRVFLDGVLIEMPGATGLEIEPGEHTVVFKIGDYSLSESFSVLPGATCVLSVDMEIDVKMQ